MTSRAKGNAGELEVAHLLKAAGFEAERTPNSGGLRVKGDLTHNCEGYHFEVKRQERLALPAWIRQAEADAAHGEIPAVVFRQSQRRSGRIGEWQAVVPFAALVDLLQTAARSRQG